MVQYIVSTTQHTQLLYVKTVQNSELPKKKERNVVRHLCAERRRKEQRNPDIQFLVEAIRSMEKSSTLCFPFFLIEFEVW